MTDHSSRRSSLRAFLTSLGVSDDEIEQAAADGQLELFAAERLLLPGGIRYTGRELAERAGIPIEQTERFWRALGFADAVDEDRVFCEDDVRALARARSMLENSAADLEVALQMTRIIGSSMARVAEAEVTPAMGSELQAEAMADAFLTSMQDTLADMGWLLDYAWRRHMLAAWRQAMLSLRRGEMGPGTVELTVGFADLVGFTLLSQELSDQALADLVSRFEALAHETVTTRGGRVVKMIGDAVMYAVRDTETSAEIALSLSDAYADDDLLSDVRVGLACGPVVAKDGDYFGPVVNLASRIVNVAKPGTVLTSDEVHETLEDRDGLTWRPLRPRQLRDVGRVQLWSLAREGDERATQDRWAWGRRRGRPGVVPAAGEILARVNELGSRRSS